MAPQKRPWHHPPGHPESHSPAAPLSLSSPRHPTGRLPEQPRRSRVFSGQVLPPLCSPPSDVLCDQSERLPGWSQESLGENTTVFPNTLLLSYSLPPWLLGKPNGTDKRMQDRPAVPTLPPWLKSAAPLCLPVAWSPNEFRRLAKRLTIRAFSATLLNCTFPLGPPQLYEGGWGQCHSRPYKASGNLQRLSLQVQKGPWQISPLLSPQTIPNLLKFKRGTFPKIQAF